MTHAKPGAAAARWRGGPPGCPLTRCEYEVLTRAAEGLTPKQIARERGRSQRTILQQMHTAYRRLGVSGAAQAVSVLGRNGWHHWQNEREPSLLETSNPLMAGYARELDRWLASGMTDTRARHGMRLALAARRNEIG